jgi:hypothetical protein
MEYTVLTAGVGFLVGGLVSLSGLGGGVLLLPLLIFGLGVAPIVAVGSGAAFSAVIKLEAAAVHWRRGNVEWRLAAALAVGSVPGALVGVELLSSLRSHYGPGVNDILSTLIGVLLVAIPVLAMVQSYIERQSGTPLRDRLPAWANRYNGAVVTGLVGGVLVGMTSVGSGSVIMMMLLLFYRREPSVLVGTDIFHAALLTAVTALAHLGLGTVDLRLVAWLVAGALPGVLLGSSLTAVLPAARLRQALFLLLITTGIAML